MLLQHQLFILLIITLIVVVALTQFFIKYHKKKQEQKIKERLKLKFLKNNYDTLNEMTDEETHLLQQTFKNTLANSKQGQLAQYDQGMQRIQEIRQKTVKFILTKE